MKKLLLIFFISSILVFSGIEAAQGNLGTFQKDICVNLVQTCENCTYNNISSITFPNSTVAQSNRTMVRDDTFYSYSFCQSNVSGTYAVNGYGDLDGVKTVWVYDFDVNRAGTVLNTQKSIIYVALLGLLIFLFIVNIALIAKLPSGNNSNEAGQIMSISNLKYLRMVFWGVGYLLVMSITFLASNLSLAYLGENMFGNFFFVLYQLMFRAMPIMLVVMVIWIFAKIAQDKEIKNMVERGVPVMRSKYT